MLNLDKKNTKILSELSENALISRYKLAKKVALSREVVDYRIKKLEKLEIIKSYQARIDISNFVYGIYMVLLRLKKFNKEIEEKIINDLKKVKYTHWLSRTTGNYDVVLTFSTTNPNQLDESLDEIFRICKEYLAYHKVLILTKELKDSFISLFNGNFREKSITKDLQKIKLNQEDREILKILSKKANITNKEISKMINLTPEAIRQRIKNLERREIIINYRTMIDPIKIGYDIFLLFMNLDNKDQNKRKQLEKFLQSNQNLIYSASSIGDFNSISVLYARDIQEFREILLRIRNNFSETLEDFSSLVISNIDQHTYYPEGFLE